MLLIAYMSFSFNLVAQNTDVYFYISERDCTNCHRAILEDIIGNEFKIILPSNYEGNLFEEFNKLYFRNKIKKENVVFSDSLSNMAKEELYGLSGVLLLSSQKKPLISYSLLELKKNYAEIKSNLFYISNNTKHILSKDKQGLSGSLIKKTSYYGKHFVLYDIVFKNMYILNNEGKGYEKIDFKDDLFDEIRKKYLKKDIYIYSETNKKELASLGEKYPYGFNIRLNKDTLYMAYKLDFVILLDSVKQTRSLDLFAKVAIKENLDIKDIVKNTYLDAAISYKDIEYFTSYDFIYWNDTMYRINDVMHDNLNYFTKDSFPLFSTFKINNDRNKFLGYTNAISNLPFQLDTLRNVNFMSLISYTNNSELVLLTSYPYAINLSTNKKYKLEWDISKNQLINFPFKNNYRQKYFWVNKKKSIYTVYVLEDKKEYLKTYNQNWELQQEKLLPFNTETVKDIRFSKDNIYLFTENELLSLPNVFE